MTAGAILDLGVPLPSNWCPYKKQFGLKIWQIGWVPHSIVGRVWNDVSIVKDLSRSESKLRRGTVRFLSLRSFKGSMALLTPWFQTSSPQLCEKWWCGSEDAISRMLQNLLHRREKDNCWSNKLRSHTADWWSQARTELLSFSIAILGWLISNLDESSWGVGGTKIVIIVDSKENVSRRSGNSV